MRSGGRAPVVVTGPMDMVAAQDRLRGFRDRICDAGTAPIVLEGDFSMEAGAAAGAALTSGIRAGEMNSVFFHNDLMALSALYVWEREGICAPVDVLVVSYDDTRAATRGLTSVTNHASDLAAVAATMLLEALAGAATIAPVTIPATLVERGTT